MKKLIFAHDHSISFNSNNDAFSNGNFPPNVIKRYSQHCDQFVFMSRGETNQNNLSDKMTKTFIENGKFVSIPSVSNPLNILSNIKAKKIIKHELSDCDFVIVRLPSFIGYLTLKYCRRYKIPYVIEVVGNQFESLWYYGTTQTKVLAFYYNIKMKKAITRAKEVVYITEEYLQKTYPTLGNEYILPNVIIDSKNFISLNKKVRTNIPNQTIYIGLIGSLNVLYKGHDILIKALSSPILSSFDFNVHFVGSGNLSKMKFNLPSNISVNHSQNISHENIFLMMRELDMLIQPSRTEAQGRVIIEAMSQSTLVLGSNVGGIPELLDKRCVFKKNDPVDLSHKVLEMLSNKDVFVDCINNNFLKSQDFNKDIIDSKRFDIYSKLMNKDKSFY